jgi:hypothetical protein
MPHIKNNLRTRIKSYIKYRRTRAFGDAGYNLDVFAHETKYARQYIEFLYYRPDKAGVHFWLHMAQKMMCEVGDLYDGTKELTEGKVKVREEEMEAEEQAVIKDKPEEVEVAGS